MHTAVLCAVCKPLHGNAMPTSLPNLLFFSPEGNMARHTWQTCSWPHELSFHEMFPLSVHFSYSLPFHAYLHSSKCMLKFTPMGFVKSLAFYVNLAWYSLHKCLICHNRRPCLLQKYLLLRAETEQNHFLIGSTKYRAASSLLRSVWSFSFLSTQGCYMPYEDSSFLCRNARSGCMFQMQFHNNHVLAASSQLLVNQCSSPSLAIHMVFLCPVKNIILMVI